MSGKSSNFFPQTKKFDYCHCLFELGANFSQKCLSLHSFLMHDLLLFEIIIMISADAVPLRSLISPPFRHIQEFGSDLFGCTFRNHYYLIRPTLMYIFFFNILIIYRRLNVMWVMSLYYFKIINDFFHKYKYMWLFVVIVSWSYRIYVSLSWLLTQMMWIT